jgi:hypothetical protein
MSPKTVPMTGIEPAPYKIGTDFESIASTNSATSAKKDILPKG